MKAAGKRMKDISELQRHIGTYSKTREVYAQYRKLTGRKQAKFYEQHANEITSCQAAKRHFNSLGLKKTSVHAIAETGVIDRCHDRPRVRYVFDVCDTHLTQYHNARTPRLWSIRPDQHEAVSAALEDIEYILGLEEQEK